MRLTRPVSLLVSLCLAAACAAPTPRATPPANSTAYAVATQGPAAVAWPEAGARFRSQGESWLGADSAYSVDLGGGRVLWLFGDTFVDPARDGSRTDGPNFFLHNSLALQTPTEDTSQYDLTRSQLAFFYGPPRAQVPTAYFPETPQADWFWPLHGTRMPDGSLLLFRMRVSKVEGGFGFNVVAWDAIAIDQPESEPGAWRPRVLTPDTGATEILLGSSVLIDGDHLYAYAARNRDDDHTISLARFTLAELSGLREGALADPEWYTASGYRRQSAGGRAEPLIAGGQIEFSVHYEARLRCFVQIQMSGLFVSDPNTAIVMRTAPRPEGPWSAPQRLWKPPAPPGTDASKLLAYAAKAHPEQRGGDLVVTYVENDVAHPTPLDSVYYPEVLRITFPRGN
ncbi:MAG TPA: DUF4185 domain-containing protein [Polyangiales bacterium]|nr:DUF4185 domain-containing protein [Polyangiales bacterium]